MTASVSSRSVEVAAQMPRTADSQPPAALPGEAAAGPASGVGATVGRRVRRQFGENPLQALFGAAVVALLVFTLTATHSRIDGTHSRIDETNDRITRLEERITRLEEKVDRRFGALDVRFRALEEDVAEVNRKLTALIAALNVSNEVGAALEGRLLDGSAVEPG